MTSTSLRVRGAIAALSLLVVVPACAALDPGDDIDLADAAVDDVGTPYLATGDMVLHAGVSPAITGSRWVVENSSVGASGKKIRNYNQNGTSSATVAPAATPADYFELEFHPRTGKDYRVWVRGWADDNHYANDSVSIQFTNSVNASGQPIYRTGTTGAMIYSVEDCSGAGLSGWGWQEPDTYSSCGSAGPTIRFAGTTARIRVQIRQDGLTIDQIVIAAASSPRPGALKNDTTIHPANATDSSGSTTSILRVVDWNIHHGNGGLNAIMDTIAGHRPDVVFLQEVPAGQIESYRARLALTTGQTWTARQSSGTAVLSRLTVAAYEVRDLGPTSYNARVAIRAQVTVGGATVNVFGTHLDWPSVANNLENTRRLLAFSDAFSGRKLVGGDLNASIDGSASQSIQLIRVNHVDTGVEIAGSDAACPGTHDNGWRPDAIYRSRTGLRTTGLRVVPSSLSDHHIVIGDYAVE